MKIIIGNVASIKMNKTVVVERVISRAHPLYKKMMRKNHRLKAHSDIPLKEGDKVKLMATAPISKEKHYKVVEKLSVNT